MPTDRTLKPKSIQRRIQRAWRRYEVEQTRGIAILIRLQKRLPEDEATAAVYEFVEQWDRINAAFEAALKVEASPARGEALQQQGGKR
jgi:hypothetical protein